MYFNITVYFSFILSSLYVVYGSENAYGHYKTMVINIQMCDQGSKPQSPHTIMALAKRFNEKGSIILSANFSVIKDIGPLRGRIRLFKWTKDKFLPSLNYVQDNVCKFFFPLTVLPVAIKVDEKCNLMKANYTITNIDFDDIVHSFLGEKFFYGKYKFIFEWFTKKLRIACMDSITQILPHEEPSKKP